MCVEGDEICDVAINFLIYRSKISRNVDAPAPAILPMERVVIQNRIKRVVRKKNHALVRLLLIFRPHFSQLLFKRPMEADVHSEFK